VPYAGGTLSQPAGIAIDPSGDAWIQNSSTVVELNNADTAALGPPYAGGFLNQPTGIAIDHSGDAWIANAGSFTVTEISSFGSVLSGSNGFGNDGLDQPEGIAIDGAGNVWTANYNGGSVAELTNSGILLSGDNGYAFNGNSVVLPQAVAIDGSGNVWIGNLAGNGNAANGSITELVGAAAPVVTPLAVGVKNNTLGTKP